jgi:hypothetical protein
MTVFKGSHFVGAIFKKTLHLWPQWRLAILCHPRPRGDQQSDQHHTHNHHLRESTAFVVHLISPENGIAAWIMWNGWEGQSGSARDGIIIDLAHRSILTPA